jgi:hypothetical protein
LPDAWWLNGIFGVAALALALFGVPKADELGPAFTYEQAAVMPEFGPGGRLQMYVPGLIANLVRFHMTGLGTSPYFLLLLGAAVALVWWRGRGALIPAPAWIMLGVGVALWALLRLFPAILMFGLYVPNRHSRWAIAVFAIVAFTAAACVVLEWVIGAAHEMRWPAAAVTSLGRALVATLAIFSVGMLWPYAHAQLAQPVDRDLERVYEFIGALPADTLVAAHPTLADNIPLRTRRSVLTSTETSMPWLAGYYRIVKPRVEASLRAAYAIDASELDSELAPYGVDVFVTGPAGWRETSYHEPYDRELVQGLLKRGRESGFALRDPPAERVLFRSGEYYVLRVGAVEPPTEGSAR